MNNTVKKKSNKKYIIGAIALILIVGIVSLITLTNNQVYAYNEDIVKISDIQTYYNFSGTVESKNTSSMVAENAMQISEVLVNEGDKVNKDDVLFRTTQGEDITAKITGDITGLYVEEGATLMGGSKLCDIMDLENLQIKIKVDEYDLPCINENDPVNVTINALDKEIQGTVESVSKIAVSNNGLSYFTAVVDLEPDDSIKVGMNAEAIILNEEALGVLTIPMKDIQFEKETNEPYVYIKNESGNTVKQVITVGINNGTYVEVTSGLSEGQQIFYPDSVNESTNSIFSSGIGNRNN